MAKTETKEETLTREQQIMQQQLEELKAAEDALRRISEHPDYDVLIKLFTDMGMRLMRECIKESDPDGVKWYQSQYAFLATIINKLENAKRPPTTAEPA